MPTRRKPTRKTRRRRTAKSKKTMVLYKNPSNPIPDSTIVKHKYCCRGVRQLSASAATTNLIFRANGMYDPEYSSSQARQHQPFFFDQMGELYNHYTVLGSKIRVKIWTDGDVDQDNDPMNVCLQLKDAAQSPVDAFAVREQPDAVYTTVIGHQRPHNLTKGFSAAKFFGKSRKNISGEAELRGTPTADPGELAYFIVTCTDPETLSHSETDVIQQFHYEVEITFTARWTERKNITLS